MTSKHELKCRSTQFALKFMLVTKEKMLNSNHNKGDKSQIPVTKLYFKNYKKNSKREIW